MYESLFVHFYAASTLVVIFDPACIMKTDHDCRGGLYEQFFLGSNRDYRSVSAATLFIYYNVVLIFMLFLLYA